MKNHFFPLLALLFCLMACNNPQDSLESELAKKLCQCMAPITKANLDPFPEGSRPDSIMRQMMMNIDSVMENEVHPCLDGLEEKYEDDLARLETEIRREMERHCPKVVSFMEKATRAFGPDS